MTEKRQINDNSKVKWRLTGKNLKFLQFLVRGIKVSEAHSLAGYSGNKEASYALKHKLKANLAIVFETEGLSKDRYLADLLQLLNLPCVNQRTGKPLESLGLDQYLSVRKLLRDELPSNKVAVPSITAFVIQRYDSGDATKLPKGDVINITPVSGRA